MPNVNWKAIPHAELAPLWFPHPLLHEYWWSLDHYLEGGTQPWVQSLIYNLIRSCSFRRVVELGTWYGSTSAWMCMALLHNGGGQYLGTEISDDVAEIAAKRLGSLGSLENVDWAVRKNASLAALPELPFQPDFVFIDDDKTDLAAKAAFFPGALAAIHDVEDNDVKVREMWPHAIVLKTPVLHATGHLALVQL